MTEFSLITKKGLRDNYTVPKSLFAQLKLNMLFCENTLNILSHPCGGEDILARNEIIRILETDISAKEQFIMLYKKITRLSKVFEHYKTAEPDCVRFFVFKECVSCYFSVLDTALPKDFYFFGRLLTYLSKLKTESKAACDAFAEYTSLLDRISGPRIVFSANGYYLAENTGNEHTSVLDRIIKDAGKLGWGRESADDDKTISFVSPLSKYLNELYPDEFEKLKELEKSLLSYMDIKLLSLIHEMDFYFDITELIRKADLKNIPHTYPALADKPTFSANELYDITLLSAEIEKITPNDVFISSDDRCFFICGANGGGKTTYLRAVASQLIMFLGGCPVFCRGAEIYAYTKVVGHFPNDEDSASYGRLDREIHDVTEIIDTCDNESFVFLNETLSGGTQSKAAVLALSTMEKLSEKGCSCLFVTHLNEVYKSAFPVLSPVVSDDEAHTRTFRIRRSYKPDGAYAGDILKKYELDEKSLGDKT